MRIFLPIQPAGAEPVTLLAGHSPQPAAGANDPESDWHGHGAILLADDEDTVLDVAARLLQSIGFEVLRAKNGEDALKQFSEHAGIVRLALVDWSMHRN